MSTAIRTEKLCKTFRRNAALNGVSLEIPEGGIYALIGPNGAGKTTTIKLLMNILQPTSGRSEVLGIESRHLSPREFARIGYVSENQNLPDWMTVEYFLAYLRPFYPNWDDNLAAQLVRQFELPPKRRLRDLSRGMRMKAALAASLSYRPEVLVLDEPFGGLDPLVRDELIAGMLEQAFGATMLVSSHDLADIESFASHVGYLDYGRLAFSEEMTVVAERFRELEIASDGPLQMPDSWPQGWLRPQSSASLLRFVHTRFDSERTPAEIESLLPGARIVAVNPMSLRSIFLALAKDSRNAAEPDKSYTAA